eukprot:TRINITY_DN16152_c0_g1_i1.p2 TRINITY_DN16152_c0_g1~~TRINITY_DN16152_c0_g1_i1.p2  ORF type:complete len:103 (-),score=26.05 TRINITY_DN16152_c0_g1_i1:2-310(-)
MAFVPTPALAARGQTAAPAPPRVCRHRPVARLRMAASPAGPTPSSAGDAADAPSAAAAPAPTAAAAAALADLASPHLPTRRRALVALLVNPPPLDDCQGTQG